MLLRLKTVVRGTKLPINLVLNVIEVRFRFIGTHFDHNQNIIKIFIFFPFPQVHMGLCTSFGPPYRGVAVTWYNFFWHPWHHTILIHNLRVGKNKSSDFVIYHPSLVTHAFMKTIDVWSWNKKGFFFRSTLSLYV